MSDDVPIEAFTFVRSPLPTPTAFGCLNVFQGMTIFPSATMVRTYSVDTSSAAATISICGVISPLRACSIWVVIGLLLGIITYGFTCRTHRIPDQQDHPVIYDNTENNMVTMVSPCTRGSE